MPILRRFVIGSTIEGLKYYFKNRNIKTEDMNWSQSPKLLTNQLLNIITGLPNDLKSRIHCELERIDLMADTIGQELLYGVTNDKASLDVLDREMDRGSWSLLNEPDNFRIAEQIRREYKDAVHSSEKVIHIPSGLDLDPDSVNLTLFVEHLENALEVSTKLTVDFTHRLVSDSFESGQEFFQFLINIQEFPQTVSEFNGNNNEVVTYTINPVSEHVAIYSKSSGVLQIRSEKQKYREAISSAFINTFMLEDNQLEKLKSIKFDLSVLNENPNFTWDAEDKIKDVQLVMLRLDSKSRFDSLCMTSKNSSKINVREHFENEFFGADHLIGVGHTVTATQINMIFEPNVLSSGSDIIPITLIAPDQADLYRRTEQERKLCEKYLKRWKIMRFE